MNPSDYFNAVETDRARRFGGVLSLALGLHVAPMTQEQAEAIRPRGRPKTRYQAKSVCLECGRVRVLSGGLCVACRPEGWTPPLSPHMCELCGTREANAASRRCTGCGMTTGRKL